MQGVLPGLLELLFVRVAPERNRAVVEHPLLGGVDERSGVMRIVMPEFLRRGRLWVRREVELAVIAIVRENGASSTRAPLISPIAQPVDFRMLSSERFGHLDQRKVGRTVRVDGLLGSLRQQTNQDRLPTPTRPRSLEQAEVGSREFQLRATANRIFGNARLQFGDVLDGRHGLESTDTVVSYNASGTVVTTQTTPSIEDAKRTNAGVFTQATYRPPGDSACPVEYEAMSCAARTKAAISEIAR